MGGFRFREQFICVLAIAGGVEAGVGCDCTIRELLVAADGANEVRRQCAASTPHADPWTGLLLVRNRIDVFVKDSTADEGHES